jgi:prophage regulatory protein
MKKNWDPCREQLAAERLPAPLLPNEGLVRLRQLLGDRKATPPVPPIIPIGKSSWWAGIRAGRYPKPVKIGRGGAGGGAGHRAGVAWRVEDIRAVIANGNAK